jgi:AcrR family transcriptional regulator
MGRRPKVHREEVLAAARAAFAERGFEATTLASIAARLGVSPAALLRHAANKEALFSACMAPGPGDQPTPLDFLAELDGTEDPREVFRRIAHALVPFAARKLDEQVARFMRAKAGERITLSPFADHPGMSPPQRGFALLEDYFRRAAQAGTLQVTDVTAAALALLGSLHSYVTLGRILKVPDPPIPLDRYLVTLVEIWTRGGIAAHGSSQPRRSSRSHRSAGGAPR